MPDPTTISNRGTLAYSSQRRVFCSIKFDAQHLAQWRLQDIFFGEANAMRPSRAMRPGAQGEREIDNNVKYYKLYLQLTRLSIISTG